MAMQVEKLLAIIADAMDVDRAKVSPTVTFAEIGDMDSISRLSLISSLESQLGPEAIFDGLRTIDNIPALLSELRSRGLVE